MDDPTIGSELAASFVWDQMSPLSPETDRWATWFYYTQGGWTLNGDFNFYSREHDLRGQLGFIDTKKCAVVMMAAEYDYVASPSLSARTAPDISGAHFLPMAKLGLCGK